jgi:hypothetical protein
MPLAFQKTIIGNPHYDAAAPKQPFWPTFFYVRRAAGAHVVWSRRFRR